MIPLSIISFTENGRKLSEKIRESMTEIQVEITDIQSAGVSVSEWVKTRMETGNALLFIGACGIAVRAIAPYLKDKLGDGPVLVIDERGYHVIPLLSGHIGGANELAWELAKTTGAEPVITTATDLYGKFAVDLFAKKNGFSIEDKSGIAKVSSKVLAGKEITISIETGHWKTEQYLPEGIRLLPYPPDCPVDVVVTSKEKQFDTFLLLKPKEYIIGFGCKRGTEKEKIEAFILQKLNSLFIPVRQVYAIASISQKRDEQGLLSWCQKERIPFFTYTAEELQEVEGDFAESAFVIQQVGVGNVCERAALKACGTGGKLFCGKYAKDGMTIAVAKREWSVRFDEE